MFFFLECPCKSKKNYISYFYIIFDTILLIDVTYGKSGLSFVLNYRLRSNPEAPVLEFPKITPSGFTIGIMIKIVLSRRNITFI